MSAVAVQPYTSNATQDPAEEASRLFVAHSECILGYCLRQLGSRSEAEDAVQTTFLHALRALRRGVVPECEAAWLTTIARNVCHGQRRTAARRGPLASDIDLDTIGLAQPDGDEEHLLVGLKDALASIPENQRRAIVLREWHGVAPREIATDLGMSATATHALLARARRSLALALTLPRRAALGVVWTLVELRSHIKALLAGMSTKAAVTTVAIVGVSVGVGGVAVESSLGSDPSRQSSVPANGTEPVESRAIDGERITSASAPQTGRGGKRVTAPEPSTAVHSLMPARVPEPTVSRGGDSTSDQRPSPELPQTQSEAPAMLPLDPLALPQVKPPTDLLPADLPPLPAAEPLPAVDLPPLPPVDPHPAVDLPSLSAVDVPPLPLLGPSVP